MINEGKIIYSGKKSTNVEELYKKLIIEQKTDEPTHPKVKYF